MRYTIIIVLALLSSQTIAAEPRLRPAQWATPIIAEHLENWYQVDQHLYRSEQPDAKAMAEIQAFGIQYVLNLRELHDDDDEIKHTRLSALHVPIRTTSITDAQIILALRLIRNTDKPVLVHCWHGADRTGTIIAMYRMVEQGWSKQEAIDELVNGGYHYHAMFDNIITYLKNVNIQAIQQQLDENK